MSSKFTTTENQIVQNARTANPNMSQRQLAGQLYTGMFINGTYTSLANRTQASVYGAVRRIDAAAQGVKVGSVIASRKSRKRSLVSA